jgi:hypothetical protein
MEMPRIRCYYTDCVFIDDGYCGAAAIEIDPDVGCMTYSRADDTEPEDEWEEGEEDLEEWDELEGDEEDEELWLDDEEEF